MANNDSLHQARKAQKDEFYTQLSDIEAELQHYTKHFAGKTVICNCDNWKWSNFVRYLKEHFSELQLKRLIACNYKPLKRDNLFERGEDESAKDAWHYEYDGTTETAELLRGDGDFRSKESIELLKQADIVVTNPPFSLFREYVAQLVRYDKRFLILGSGASISYKNIFPLIKENKIWLGYKPMNDAMSFIIPDDYIEEFKKAGRDTAIKEVDGKWLGCGFCCWFTNLEHDKHQKPMKLSIKYDPQKFPKYDNYDAINIDRIRDIPYDYEGVMGVPVTFLDKYCPEQFEIIGACNTASVPGSIKLGNDYTKFIGYKQNGEKIGRNGSPFCSVPVIEKDDHINIYYEYEGKRVQPTYQRIFIRHKHPQKD